MTLSALIKKGGLAKAATATPATIATQEVDQATTVAAVATVTVTNAQDHKVRTATALPEHFQKDMVDACRGLSISQEELYNRLAGEDIDTITPDTLAAFARSLVQRREMHQGKVPAHYSEHAFCKLCGPVWLWFSGEVDGCPWCWIRMTGRPIPHPVQSGS
jgi:hypothetical protein